MNVREFLEAVEAASVRVGRAAESPIKGWGLRYPKHNADWFEAVEIEPASGCTSGQCAHNSHDPAAPVVAWVPKDPGIRLVKLGGEWDGDETYTWYVLAVKGEEVRLYRLSQERGYWTEIRTITYLTDWVLAQFRQVLEEARG